MRGLPPTRVTFEYGAALLGPHPAPCGRALEGLWASSTAPTSRTTAAMQAKSAYGWLTTVARTRTTCPPLRSDTHSASSATTSSGAAG